MAYPDTEKSNMSALKCLDLSQNTLTRVFSSSNENIFVARTYSDWDQILSMSHLYQCSLELFRISLVAAAVPCGGILSSGSQSVLLVGTSCNPIKGLVFGLWLAHYTIGHTIIGLHEVLTVLICSKCCYSRVSSEERQLHHPPLPPIFYSRFTLYSYFL